MTDDDANLVLAELTKIEAAIARLERGLNKMSALISNMECHMGGYRARRCQLAGGRR
jgi:hypothetical protein